MCHRPQHTRQDTESDNLQGHLLERMLDGQLTAERFWRPFEPAWRFQLVEWLKDNSYASGMPSDKRANFDKVLREGVDDWQKRLRDAGDEVRVSASLIDWTGTDILARTKSSCCTPTISSR